MKEIKDPSIRSKIEDYCKGGLGCKAIGNIWETGGMFYKVELLRHNPARKQIVHIMKSEVETDGE
ncbi:hypothetical protein [Gallibacter intestinalis]|uniref:Uncharacterized protein n=1 Tax=Gallibacter intestinalis TaxID=2779356 RepID=A0ABR9QXT6_9FIRM|nr:hypothetical protein [Gallibacter intestinalis]MBE5035692.1 hypothetical protein [Gallibacter intestinalis]